MLCFGQSLDYKAKGDSLLNAAVAEGYCVGISSGFSIDGEIVWQGSAGELDLSNHTEFLPSTLNRIASIAKPITAIAILQLYEKEKIDLDASVQTYLPDFPVKSEGAITIRHLLNHTSGIGAYKSNKERENQKHFETLEEAIRVFEARDLLSIPGESYAYTTYGYVVLGRVIEVVSGLEYGTYVQNFIFEPLKMNHTGVEISGKNYAHKSNLYHRNSKGKISKAEQHDLSNRVPGGGFFSTVPDMLKFGDAILNHTLISKTTSDMMFANTGIKKEGNGYGLGWYLYGENPLYGPVYGHNGAQTGASTFLMLLPDQSTSIVVLSNTSGAMQQVSDITIKLFSVSAEAGQ